jgi:hypothetical protein
VLESSSSRNDIRRACLGRRVEVLLFEDWNKACLGVSLMVA